MNTGPLEAKLSATVAAELRALQQESDPALYQEGLYRFAFRLEQEDRFEAAAEIYGNLSESSENGAFSSRARQRLQALQGQGPFGAHFEILLRNFSKEAASPSAILAMGVGSLAFRLTRAATLSRLAASPTAGFLTRGWGLSAAATLTGFASETTAFTLAGKGGASLLGEKSDWSARTLGKEWLSGALLLGSLKMAGALTESGLKNGTFGNSPLLRLAQGVVPTATSYGGILLGEGLQSSLGLKAHCSKTNFFLDAFATLLQFHVGGRLAGEVFGPGFSRMERALDLRAESFQTPPPIFPAPALASSLAAPSRVLPERLSLEPWMAPMLMQGEEGGGATAGEFRVIRQIESKVSQGRILMDLGTREEKLFRETFRRMVSLEDAFSSLMLNYHTQETALLKGPLAELLRQEETLRHFLWSYAVEKGKQLWAFIDTDTGELQRLVTFNKDRSPGFLLYWDPGRNGAGRRPQFSTAISLNFASSASALPSVFAEAFRWNAEDKTLHREEGVASGQGPSVALFASTPHEMRFSLPPGGSMQWNLQDSRGRTLFAMYPLREDGQHFFEFDKQAPLLPLRSARPSEPKTRQPQPRLKEASLPPPPPSPEGDPLQSARSVLQDLKNPIHETPRGLQQAFKALRNELKKLSDSQLEAFVPELAGAFGLFFRFGEPGCKFLMRQIPNFPTAARQRLLLALADPLVDPEPQRRVAAFEVFREVLLKLGYGDLGDLAKALDQKFPPGTLGRDRGLLVQQIRMMIGDLLRGSSGGGGVPGSALIALIAGAGTLFYGHEAAAGTFDALSNGFGVHHGQPLLSATMLAGVATFALRSKLAQRLGAEALSVGSALLARFTRGNTPLILERDGQYPYRLVLPELDRILVSEQEFLIAKRERREVFLKILAVTDRLAPFERYPSGTLRVSFNLQEGDRVGGGILFLEPDSVSLYNIQTRNMKAGAGTIFLDWLATQAVLKGRNFSIREIHNPQVFRIVRREGFMEDPDLRVAGKYHVPFAPHGAVEYEGTLQDPFLDEEHQGAAFTFKGRPNPSLLPFYLRLRPVPPPKAGPTL